MEPKAPKGLKTELHSSILDMELITKQLKKCAVTVTTIDAFVNTKAMHLMAKGIGSNQFKQMEEKR